MMDCSKNIVDAQCVFKHSAGDKSFTGNLYCGMNQHKQPGTAFSHLVIFSYIRDAFCPRKTDPAAGLRV